MRRFSYPFLCVVMLAGLAFTRGVVRGASSRPQDAPFELWPTNNGAQPTTYTKTAPPFDAGGTAWPYQGGVPVTVKVDADRILRRVNPYLFGVNAMVWSGKDWFLDPDRVEKAKQAGLRFWRYPGGSYSNTYHWDGDYKGRKTNNENRDPSVGSGPSFIHTDDFIEFCRRTGSEAIVTVNYGCARYGSPGEAADLAARWVRHFNFQRKFRVRYWEIGNENYGPWEDGYKVEGRPPMDGVIYGKDFAVIEKAMRKVDPDIFLGAPCVRFDGEGQWDGYLGWMRQMLPLVRGKADFLVQHNYFGKWPFDGDRYTPNTDEALWADLGAVADIKVQTDSMVSRYTKGWGTPPVAFTEFNLVQAPTQSIQLFNGLYEACVLGEQVRAGFAAGNFWAFQNGFETKTQGDNGLLSNRDPEMADGTPRPVYYTYALYHRAFGDRMVDASTSAAAVRVYASLFEGGELGLVAVNRGGADSAVSLEIAGFKPVGKAMGWALTGKDLHGKQVSWNGVEGPVAGGGPFPLDPIKPYVARAQGDGTWALGIPAHSAVGWVFY